MRQTHTVRNETLGRSRSDERRDGVALDALRSGDIALSRCNVHPSSIAR